MRTFHLIRTLLLAASMVFIASSAQAGEGNRFECAPANPEGPAPSVRTVWVLNNDGGGRPGDVQLVGKVGCLAANGAFGAVQAEGGEAPWLENFQFYLVNTPKGTPGNAAFQTAPAVERSIKLEYLLLEKTTEKQLLFTLGHEFGHGVGQHSNNKKIAAYLGQVAAAIGLFLMLAGTWKFWARLWAKLVAVMHLCSLRWPRLAAVWTRLAALGARLVAAMHRCSLLRPKKAKSSVPSETVPAPAKAPQVPRPPPNWLLISVGLFLLAAGGWVFQCYSPNMTPGYELESDAFGVAVVRGTGIGHTEAQEIAVSLLKLFNELEGKCCSHNPHPSTARRIEAINALLKPR